MVSLHKSASWNTDRFNCAEGLHVQTAGHEPRAQINQTNSQNMAAYYYPVTSVHFPTASCDYDPPPPRARLNATSVAHCHSMVGSRTHDGYVGDVSDKEQHPVHIGISSMTRHDRVRLPHAMGNLGQQLINRSTSR